VAKKKRRPQDEKRYQSQDRGWSPAFGRFVEIDSIEVKAWCPDVEAALPPEQVHFNLNVKGNPFPLVLRWKRPEILDEFIYQLTRYRNIVWPPEKFPVANRDEAEQD